MKRDKDEGATMTRQRQEELEEELKEELEECVPALSSCVRSSEHTIKQEN